MFPLPTVVICTKCLGTAGNDTAPSVHAAGVSVHARRETEDWRSDAEGTLLA